MGPWRIDRRGFGVVVLLTSLLLSVVMPFLIHPGLPGAADRAPLPEPPAVGSCLRTGLQIVPCSVSHDAEVAYTWPAGQNPSERRSDGSRPDACRDRVAEYVGADGWSATPVGWQWYPSWMVYGSKLTAAPSAEGISGLRWHACLVGPTQIERFTGSVQGTAAAGSIRPAPFGICSNRDDYAGNVVSCAQPHTFELIGYMPVTAELVAAHPHGLPASEVAQAGTACLQMVKTMTGSADLTFGGRLAIVAQNVWPNWVQTALGNGRTADLGLPQCLVEVVGNARLVGTVAGLGERPLPLQ